MRSMVAQRAPPPTRLPDANRGPSGGGAMGQRHPGPLLPLWSYGGCAMLVILLEKPNGGGHEGKT